MDVGLGADVAVAIRIAISPTVSIGVSVVAASGSCAETIAKLKIRPAASADAGFHLLSDVLRSRAVMWQMCADYDGSSILGSGIVIRVRRRLGPLRGRGQRRCSGLELCTTNLF